MLLVHLLVLQITVVYMKSALKNQWFFAWSVFQTQGHKTPFDVRSILFNAITPLRTTPYHPVPPRTTTNNTVPLRTTTFNSMNNPRKKSGNTVHISWFSQWKTCWIGTTECDTKMVRGSGDPPKPGTRKSIGCPVYPISQCFNLFLANHISR